MFDIPADFDSELPHSPEKDNLIQGANLTDHALKILESKLRDKRNAVTSDENPILSSVNPNVPVLDTSRDVFDGEIDINSNYTGFLEIIGKW